MVTTSLVCMLPWKALFSLVTSSIDTSVSTELYIDRPFPILCIEDPATAWNCSGIILKTMYKYCKLQ